jgi:hypothetical protein
MRVNRSVVFRVRMTSTERLGLDLAAGDRGVTASALVRELLRRAVNRRTGEVREPKAPSAAQTAPSTGRSIPAEPTK